ncbi:AfsR/SARP family transcriptional regulator [Streptomyces eurythermus]|uniref:AfsR/SARP family transcriptional regulator n=1 Tax=Streptomyces eurythermus TaxID=42237 RepID=UPI0036F728C0
MRAPEDPAGGRRPHGPDEACEGLRFRLFGPLTVTRDGCPVAIPQTKHRIVLAALLLRANQLVTVDELITHLWGDAPPLTARKTLQGYVARLRKRLGHETLLSHPLGYRIEVRPDRLDLTRFTSLVEEADRTQDDARRARLLRAALDLASGEPLADLPHDCFRHGDRAELTERLLHTVERWADAEMALGRHSAVLPRLRALAAEHPFRETLWSRRMRALYGAGRQADALTAYQQARRVLRDELGVDPGEELRRLHQRILAGDLPVPAPREEPAAPEPPAAPFTLPPAVSAFARPALEAEALRLLLGAETDAPAGGPGPAVVALHGAVGTGKTTLAVRVGHAAAGRFPDGQLFAELRDGRERRSPSDVLRTLLRLLGVEHDGIPRGLPERVALYRSLLAGKRVLVVLDGAESEAQVRPLLPPSSRSAALVTSIAPLAALDGARHLRVGKLTAGESVEILTRIAGPERVRAEPEAVATLVERCDGLPLAVRIVGAKLLARPHWRLAQLALRLDSARRLDELTAGDLSVRDSLGIGYQELGEAARRAFRLLSLVRTGSFPAGTAAAALDLSEDEAGELLDEIVHRQLLRIDLTPDGRLHYGYDALVRDYARELAVLVDPAAERARTVRRALAAHSARPMPVGA